MPVAAACSSNKGLKVTCWLLYSDSIRTWTFAEYAIEWNFFPCVAPASPVVKQAQQAAVGCCLVMHHKRVAGHFPQPGHCLQTQIHHPKVGQPKAE